jgi:hypothetical protein
MLFFVPPHRREEVIQRLQKLLCVPFAASARGSQVIVYEPEAVYESTREVPV